MPDNRGGYNGSYGNRGAGGGYNGGNRGTGGGGYGGGNRGGYNNNRTVEVPKEEHLSPGSDYVGLAEEKVSNIFSEERNVISTSKLRNFLAMVSVIYDKELRSGKDTLSPDSISALMLMRVRLAYECGRDPGTKRFVEKTKMISYLKGVKTKEDFMTYAHYLEAIIAYHRYFGGKE